MKQTWEEFKNFAMKGNVIDLAIGVIIGAAFTPIVATLVANIIMPVIGFVTAGVDFSALAVTPVEVGGDQVRAVSQRHHPVPDHRRGAVLPHQGDQHRAPARARRRAPAASQSEIYLKEIRDALVKGKP